MKGAAEATRADLSSADSLFKKCQKELQEVSQGSRENHRISGLESRVGELQNELSGLSSSQLSITERFRSFEKHIVKLEAGVVRLAESKPDGELEERLQRMEH